MNDDESGDLTAFLDARLTEAGEPSPESSPVPGGSPSPTPSVTPLAVQDDGLIALVREVHREEHAQRVAVSGSFIVLCLILTTLGAIALLLALRRK